MSKQTFVANTILTAAQMNTLQTNDYNQTVSTKTASYTLVAADAGTKIVMNSASATTITVNTSLFAAGDNLTIANIGAGVCTVTAGTATVSSAGPLAIPQYGTGTLYFTSAGVSIYSPTAVTVAAPAAAGLTFITDGSASVSSGITIANCFSSTYENYLVTLALTGNPAQTSTLMNFGTSSTKYSGATYNYNLEEFSFYNGSATRNLVGALDDTKFRVNNKAWTNGFTAINIYAPNLARPTSYFASSTALNANPEIETNVGGGVVDQNTQYTDLFFTPTSQTFSFTYKIYGFSNS
jgi:hypothetical protein